MQQFYDGSNRLEFISYVAPSEWGLARKLVKSIGAELGPDIVKDNIDYIKKVSSQLRGNRNFTLHYLHKVIWNKPQQLSFEGF